MSLKQINTKAKAIRRQKPGMSWHAAQKAAAAQMRGTHKTKRKTTTAVGKRKTTHHKRHAVGSTHAAATPRKRKKKASWFGATNSTTTKAVQILRMGAGMAVGAAGTHIILRPIEHKIVGMVSDPKISTYVAKAMPWAEMFVGGLGWIMFRNRDVQNIALGVMGTGVHAAAKQLPIHMHSPAETVQGISGHRDMVQVRIPVNGTLRQQIAGLIQQENGYTRTPTVGSSLLYNNNGAVKTPIVAGQNSATLYNTPTVGDLYDDEYQQLFYSNPFRR